MLPRAGFPHGLVVLRKTWMACSSFAAPRVVSILYDDMWKWHEQWTTWKLPCLNPCQYHEKNVNMYWYKRKHIPLHTFKYTYVGCKSPSSKFPKTTFQTREKSVNTTTCFQVCHLHTQSKQQDASTSLNQSPDPCLKLHALQKHLAHHASCVEMCC